MPDLSANSIASWLAQRAPAIAADVALCVPSGEEHEAVLPSVLRLGAVLDATLSRSPDHLKTWLAFSVQKIKELSALGKTLVKGREAVIQQIADSAVAAGTREASPKVHDAAVAARVATITPDMARRRSSFDVRRKVQQRALNLPSFPTTTIGSFPQTDEVRKARAARAKGTLSDADYAAFLRKETEAAVRWQEEIGIDVLVHGEFERNDMVQYFGERLAGYAFTKHAWNAIRAAHAFSRAPRLSKIPVHKDLTAPGRRHRLPNIK